MKKNPYQFTIRFNSTIAGHCQAAAFLNRCGTRAKAHVIAEALDLYLREKKQLLGLGGIGAYRSCTGNEWAGAKRR